MSELGPLIKRLDDLLRESEAKIAGIELGASSREPSPPEPGKTAPTESVLARRLSRGSWRSLNQPFKRVLFIICGIVIIIGIGVLVAQWPF